MVNPFALFAFLLSDCGRSQTQQIRYGSAQPNLSIPYLKNLITVPNLGDRLDAKLEALVDSAVNIAHSETTLYNEAELELLDRLGWKEMIRTTPELFYSADFSELNLAGRVDAEFSHPFCHRLRQQISRGGGLPISGFCAKPNRGVQPEVDPAGRIIALDSKSIRPLGVEPSGDLVTEQFYNTPGNAKARVKKGDVLLNSTGRGTLGRASFYQLDAAAVCDNHVAILRPDPKVCNPRYLALFLNSASGITQSEQSQTGSSGQLEIYPCHIEQFLVFLPRTKSGAIDLAWQKELADKVEAATRAREGAASKLAEACALVEKAIETGSS